MNVVYIHMHIVICILIVGIVRVLLDFTKKLVYRGCLEYWQVILGFS